MKKLIIFLFIIAAALFAAACQSDSNTETAINEDVITTQETAAATEAVEVTPEPTPEISEFELKAQEFKENNIIIDEENQTVTIIYNNGEVMFENVTFESIKYINKLYGVYSTGQIALFVEDSDGTAIDEPKDDYVQYYYYNNDIQSYETGKMPQSMAKEYMMPIIRLTTNDGTIQIEGKVVKFIPNGKDNKQSYYGSMIFSNSEIQKDIYTLTYNDVTPLFVGKTSTNGVDTEYSINRYDYALHLNASTKIFEGDIEELKLFFSQRELSATEAERASRIISANFIGFEFASAFETESKDYTNRPSMDIIYYPFEVEGLDIDETDKNIQITHLVKLDELRQNIFIADDTNGDIQSAYEDLYNYIKNNNDMMGVTFVLGCANVVNMQTQNPDASIIIDGYVTTPQKIQDNLDDIIRRIVRARIFENQNIYVPYTDIENVSSLFDYFED